MYRRKIGKKIFRRTRKHKFYGIKVKKGPSMLTRRRVRRGGGENVVHSVIGKLASRSFFLTKPKCNELLNRAKNAQRKYPNRDITYTPEALGDKKYCKTTHNIDIDEELKTEHEKTEQEKTEQELKANIMEYNYRRHAVNDSGITPEEDDKRRDAEDDDENQPYVRPDDYDDDDDDDDGHDGGSKSRRTRRRKHNHKTHHKRASKSHKRRRHSRVVRKHKKHTSHQI